LRGARMSDERDRDLETFRTWMDQLNHEDFLILGRVSLSILSQPVFIVGYILAKQYQLSIVPEIILLSNLLISILIFISILAAFRVYLETRVKIRALFLNRPDLPMRSLPNVHPGLGLYAPVAIGLIMVLVWSSLLYVEAGQDVQLQNAAKLITGALAVVGAAFAIGVGMILGQNDPPAHEPSSADEIPIARAPEEE
jgi:hypothetical protein